MFHVSEKVNIAIHALGYMSANRNSGSPVTAATIAEALHVSESHLAKVMQILARVGFVESLRGARGGYCFKREPGDISLLDVIEAVDGPLVTPGCLLGTPICRAGECILLGLKTDLTVLLDRHLGATTIDAFRMN